MYRFPGTRWKRRPPRGSFLYEISRRITSTGVTVQIMFVLISLLGLVRTECPQDMVRVNEKCYKHYLDEKNETEAEQSCHENGGALAGESDGFMFVPNVLRDKSFSQYLNAELNPQTANRCYLVSKKTQGPFPNTFLDFIYGPDAVKCSLMCYKAFWTVEQDICKFPTYPYLCEYLESTVKRSNFDVPVQTELQGTTTEIMPLRTSVNNEGVTNFDPGAETEIVTSSGTNADGEVTLETLATRTDSHVLTTLGKDLSTVLDRNKDKDVSTTLNTNDVKGVLTTMKTTMTVTQIPPPSKSVQTRTGSRLVKRSTLVCGEDVFEEHAYGSLNCFRLCATFSGCEYYNFNSNTKQCRGFSSYSHLQTGVPDWNFFQIIPLHRYEL